MNLMEALAKETSMTSTENGASALKSTGSDLVDLFGSIGSMRTRSHADIEHAFFKGFAENADLTMKMLFYTRDIRGGLGERDVFRTIMRRLAELYPDTVKKNLVYFSEYGRWDDLLCLLGSKVHNDVIELIRKQLDEDLSEEYPTLMAKWLPSENASSAKTKELAKILIKDLKLTPKYYRKKLSFLRKKINIVEAQISAGKWDAIEYSKVPSRAMMIYRTAFYKHDEDRFQKYIDSVTKGDVEIKASTLFPYDILHQAGFSGRGSRFNMRHDDVLQAQWNALPNYIEGENNILVVADTSGSMCGQPMETSVGLAMYFAERNQGIFKDKFITFSSEPSFVTVSGNTLYEKVKCIPSIISNTNLEATFDLVLTAATANGLSQADMPKSLVIISDMEFDQARGMGGWGEPKTDAYNTLFDKIVAKYNRAGYEMPNVVFWNVNSRNSHFQANSAYKGVQMASGQNPSVFKSILANIGKTPYEAMLETLNSDRYAPITA